MHHFEAKLLPDPQSILRVLGIFAQRQWIAHAVHCERRAEHLYLSVMMADLDVAVACNIANRLQQLFVVQELCWNQATAARAA